jgi:hypothetical protein
MIYGYLLRLTPLLAGAAIFSGAVPLTTFINSGEYDEEVAAPVEKVSEALADLHMDEFTSYTSEAMVTQRKERTASGYVWSFDAIDDGQELIELEVKLEPTDGGASTRVKAETRLGSGSDPKKTPKILQYEGWARTMFAAALEDELEEVKPEAEQMPHSERKQRRFNKVMAATTLTAIATMPGAPPNQTSGGHAIPTDLGTFSERGPD